MINYFKPKSFETYNQKTIYEYFGIKHFKKYLITDGDLVRKWRNVKQIDLNRNSRILELQKAEKETRKYEIIHLIFILVSVLIVVFKYDQLSVVQWILIIAINLYANVYPIFLQRYNRIRILRILEKNKSVSGTKAELNIET
tara:strand:- start:3860 stop:4285 length:426 start_codon:yes stop_codon:yes gene_type:complete